MWEKLIDTGEAAPSSFACYRNLLAVANPKRGIRIWELKNGMCSQMRADEPEISVLSIDSWLPFERAVLRKDVLCVKFLNNGNDLLCSCADGTL